MASAPPTILHHLQERAAKAAAGDKASAAGAADTKAGSADAGAGSDVARAWKQYTSPDGRPYYYNRITKESKWTMPEEMKAAAASGAQWHTHDLQHASVVVLA